MAGGGAGKGLILDSSILVLSKLGRVREDNNESILTSENGLQWRTILFLSPRNKYYLTAALESREFECQSLTGKPIKRKSCETFFHNCMVLSLLKHSPKPSQIFKKGKPC